VLAVGTNTREDRPEFLRRCAVDAFLQKRSIAKHGGQRRSQLMAHVSDELRLVLARDLELAALLGDLPKQASVLHGDRGLGSEGLDQPDDLRREGARLVAPDDQYTYDLCLVQQRYGKNRTHAGAQKDAEQRRRCRTTKVSNLNDLAARSAFADDNAIEPHRLRPHHCNVLVAHVVSGREPKFIVCLVKHIHGAAVNSSLELDKVLWRAWEFLAGGLIGAQLIPTAGRLPRIVLELIGWVGLSAIILAVVLFNPTLPYPSSNAVLPIVGAALVILCGLAEPRASVARPLSVRWLVGIGLVSYGWYLWHWPI
jgi:hypothetical protein